MIIWVWAKTFNLRILAKKKLRILAFSKDMTPESQLVSISLQSKTSNYRNIG